MKKTLDFNKLAKAHKAKKAWEQLQKEKSREKSESSSNQNSLERTAKPQSIIRKSS